ncbi:hypothetical protein GW17_00012657 [Ensete ventricosum]|nr:hypothetical protein GW17_00012657 [Ensete ventricosum]
MQQLGVAITGEKSSHLKLFVMSSPLWFAISTCTVRYGRYISVRQVTGRRTARYRACRPHLPAVIARGSPVRRRRPRVSRPLFIPREETERLPARGDISRRLILNIGSYRTVDLDEREIVNCFDRRKGVLVQISATKDHGVGHLKLLSFVEMVVPYGDPNEPHYRKNAFDAGEDGLGKNAHSLKKVKYARDLDSHAPSPFAPSLTISATASAVVLSAAASAVDAANRVFLCRRPSLLSFLCCPLPLLSTATVSLLSAAAVRSVHRYCCCRLQHCRGCIRLVVEVNVKIEEPGKDNIHNNAFYAEEKLLRSELQAMRDCQPSSARHWIVHTSLYFYSVRNTRTVNRTGQPAGYKLMPGSNCLPLAGPEAKFLRRAAFLKHNLWVTSYKHDEMYPGGEFPNQNPRINEGLATWVRKNRSLEETDIVLWLVS